MALHDGFFDAQKIDVNKPDDDWTNYDRAYESGAYTEYFKQFIGSGVCIYNNPDSFRVSYQGGALTIAPGYLFISGFWLKNDDAYTVPLAEAGVYAVVARLDTGNRMIKLETEAKAGDYASELTLVLAFVTVSSGGTAEVEDTRYNEDICGIIDSAGSLSGKVEYAINYIETEINSKLEQAEQQIAEQAARLNAKIAEVNALVDTLEPPAVGTIKFSASQNVDSTWLKCDGSFVNERDYPELVEALGKLTPGVDDFNELLGADSGEYMSNCCLYGGYVWAYLLKSKKLVGYPISGGEKKEISVSGVNDLVQLAAVDTVLSVCGGAVYLAQNNQTTSTFVLLECANFTGSESSIEMEKLDTTSATSGLDMTDFVPRITEIGSKVNLALGRKTTAETASNGSYRYFPISVIQWSPGGFSSKLTKTYPWAYDSFSSSGAAASWNAENNIRLVKSLLGFNPKNANEFLFAQGLIRAYSLNAANATVGVNFRICSETQQIYGALDSDFSTLPTPEYLKSGISQTDLYKDPYYQQIISQTDAMSLNVMPVAAANEYLYRAEIKSGNLRIDYGTYNPLSVYERKTVNLSLPSRARLFKESVCYAASQGLWFVFVGTGLLFTESLSEGEWGYLDTQDTLGAITQFGCVDYDDATNTLYLSGVASNGVPKLGEMHLPDLYDYANDGAWLPMIAADGVPAFIKALPGEGSGGGTAGKRLTVNVSYGSESYVQGYYVIEKDGVILTDGAYYYEYPSGAGTFQVTLRKTATSATSVYLKANGTTVATLSANASVGDTVSATLDVSRYIESGLELSLSKNA